MKIDKYVLIYKINIFKYTLFEPQIVINQNINYLCAFSNLLRD